MATLNISQKNVADGKNTFFKGNRILMGNGIPTSGSYVRGDIIVNVNTDNDKRCMWICTESGTPGSWALMGGSLISTEARIVVNEPVTEVPITGLGGVVEPGDKLDVFLNSVHLLEDEDYIISSDGSKISKAVGTWNITGDTAIFDFILVKQVEKVESENVVINSNQTKTAAVAGKAIVNGPQTQVAIPAIGFSKSTDSLLVFKNGVIMTEGIDYQISGGNIVSLTGTWNASNIAGYEMTFVALKEIVLYDSSIMDMQLKRDESLSTEAKTVVDAINELKAQIDVLNADLLNMASTVNTLNAQVASQAAIIEEQNNLLDSQRLQGIAAANSLLDEL